MSQRRPAPGKTTRVDMEGSARPRGDVRLMRAEGPPASAGPWEADQGLLDAMGLFADDPARAPASGGGSALPEAVQAKMSASFGADFSDVRVHQDDRAASVGAEAYASGSDLHFAPGTYDPDSESGQALIAHELAHVVQQREGRVGGAGVVVDHGLEAEADAQGARAARGEVVASGGSGGASTSGAAIQGKGIVQLSAAAPASRAIDGDGGYRYEQFADGTIQIVAGPSGAGKTLPPGDPVNVAITKEIEAKHGPFPSAEAAPAAPPAEEAPAATGPSLPIPSLDEIVDGIGDVVSAIGDFLFGEDPAAAEEDPASAAPEGAAPEGEQPAEEAPAPDQPPAATAPIDPANHQSRESFLHPDLPQDKALAHPTTAALVAAIWPHFKKGDQVAGGYLNVFQQFWKVNYHWEGAVKVCDLAQDKDISEEHKARFASIAAELRASPPSPATGRHPTDAMTIGDSTAGEDGQTWTDAFRTRYDTLKRLKPQLGALISESGVMAKITSAAEKEWFTYSSKPCAEPEGAGSDPTKQTHHGRGYALDIRGNTATISDAARALGATVVFPEGPHVHVEFPDGIRAPAPEDDEAE